MKDFAASRREFEGWPEEKRRRLLGKLVDAIGKAKAIPIGSVMAVRGPDALSQAVQKH